MVVTGCGSLVAGRLGCEGREGGGRWWIGSHGIGDVSGDGWKGRGGRKERGEQERKGKEREGKEMKGKKRKREGKERNG